MPTRSLRGCGHRAYEYALNLDYDEATREMEAAVKADPNDPSAERGLATIPWPLISFRRGAATVDDYLGGVTRQNVALREPPADLAPASTRTSSGRRCWRKRCCEKPRDADAHYQVGATVGLQASYIATVEGRIIGAFRAARRAYDEVRNGARARRRRAKTPGSSSACTGYVVSLMSLPLRMMAYVAVFGGGKERGLADDRGSGGLSVGIAV